MSERLLMKGNEALAEAAVRAGFRYYFGYPITPQSELPEYLAKRLPEVGGLFLQAESEVASINMVYGAAAAGARTMTSTSSPGFSLMQEGISYLAGSELPCVLVNMMRGGPGVGSILPAQADYLQATKGGGNGDYRILTYAPASVQEMADLTALAFAKADEYRNPVMILGDGLLGQMMEPVVFKEEQEAKLPEKPWAVGRRMDDRAPNHIHCVRLDALECEKHNRHLKAKYDKMRREEVRWEEIQTEDAEIVLAAFGTVARICRTALDRARKRGLKVGLIRPITVWPFPYNVFKQCAATARAFLTVEMNEGQMLEDVQLGVGYKAPVYFYGRNGGVIPDPKEIEEQIEKVLAGEVQPVEDRI